MNPQLNQVVLRRARNQGFSLVELMVGLTIGLLVLASVSAVIVNSSNTRRAIEKAGLQIENGRYAMQVLSDDLKLAGYFGELDFKTAQPAPTVPAALPDPCSTAVADLKAALAIHIQGYDQAAIIPACLADVKANTDILLIRRASTCAAGDDDNGCADFVEGVAYIQSSQNEGELNNSAIDDYDVATTQASLQLKDRSGDLANRYKYHVNIYFIANNNETGDGIPTLKRAELNAEGGAAGAFTIVPLVEGIEDMQVEYGIDTDDDSVPNEISASPATTQAWHDVLTADMHLLVRSTEPTPGDALSRTYTLGQNAPVEIEDKYRRHVYSASVRLINPAGRRE